VSRRVVITGLGAVSGLGLNASSFWDGLKAGHTAIQPLESPVEDLKITVGAAVPDYQPESYFTSDELTLLDRFSQFAVIAAREAVEDAGLAGSVETMTGAAAVIGSGCGGKQTDEITYDLLYKQNKKRVHPLTIPRGMPSAAASMVSIHLGIKGPVFSVASACASGSHALILGCSMIQSGLVEIALVGASDAPFTYGLLKAWEALRVVTNDTCRPFCADRSGIALGEGAGMLILESEAHARSRGARIYAELAGSGMTSDAGHITRPDISGISSAMQKALTQAELNPYDIDYINAHGTATQANDIAETEAISHVFGTHASRLSVSSTKSMHGHALGASSALETIATTLAIFNGIVPPTANFTTAGELCNLDYVPNISRELAITTALSNSFAFGGLNTSLVVRKYA